MFARLLIVALNTYREAVRGRILHGLLALAVATCGYSLVVGAYALRNQNKVVSDLGAASISIYAVVVAIVVSATSLYRELEHKTVFPILARPIERWEYLVGKYLGSVLTLSVFVALDAGLLLFSLGALTGRALWLSIALPLAVFALGGLLYWRLPRSRTWLPLPLGFVLLVLGSWFASAAVAERSVVLGQCLLTVMEVSIVSAIALVFASFSSPFLTAIFTLSIFLIGRSADTLAKLPERVFGSFVKEAGEFLSHTLPNLMVYAPPRTLLTGEAAGRSFGPYALEAGVQALAWTVGLLALSSFVFRRRDFL